MKNIVKSIDNSIKYLKIFRKYISGQSLPDWKKINKSKTKKKILNKKKRKYFDPSFCWWFRKILSF